MKTRVMVVVAACMWLGGCAAYVNIPPQAGDIAVHDPNRDNVRDVLTAALTYAVAGTDDGEVYIQLPAASNAETYSHMLPTISPSAVWSPDPPEEGQAVFDVRQVRIRGWKAEVDIIQPEDMANPDGLQQVVTYYLRQAPFGDWSVQRRRVWRVPVDRALTESARLTDVQ